MAINTRRYSPGFAVTGGGFNLQTGDTIASQATNGPAIGPGNSRAPVPLALTGATPGGVVPNIAPGGEMDGPSFFPAPTPDYSNTPMTNAGNTRMAVPLALTGATPGGAMPVMNDPRGEKKANNMADANKISSDTDLLNQVGEVAAGETTGIPQLQAALPTVQTGEMQTATNAQISGTSPQATTTMAGITGLEAVKPTPSSPSLGQIDATTTIAPSVGTATTSQIDTTPQIDMTGVQGTVSTGAVATAATQELDEKATTQYQLGQLLGSIEEGKPMPAWAAPAVRKVAGVMQARGLGASSMAAAAMTQAVMESGVVIASQDANKYATIQLQNLNNQQQTALTNAATFAAMDKANLSARLQGAVTNAQNLLATETKNLDARQQGNTLTYNALTQALFKDAAEDNARKQFNAKNEIQVEEFFANLGSQVDTANKNRIAATAQFNAGEVNAQAQFNTAMRDNREKFNANMQFAVDQSNVQWRRQVNTAATAVQNETNRINVANAYNSSQNALNNLWQKYRDNAAWNFQKTESYMQRQHEVGIMAMEFANTKALYSQQQKDNLALGIGNWIAAWMGGSGSDKSTNTTE